LQKVSEKVGEIEALSATQMNEVQVEKMKK